SLCHHLKADRCILHDCHEGKTGFLSEYHNQFAKSLIDSDKRSNNNTTPIAAYVNFQNYLFGTINTINKDTTTILCEDINHDPRFQKIEEICIEFGIRSQISVMTTFNN